MKEAYEREGYFLLENAIGAQEIQSLIRETSVFEHEHNNYGVRDLMNKLPYVRQLATSAPLLPIARAILGADARPVRAVYFDKVPGANWNVAWHQDTSIALKARADVPGFGVWSLKQGVVHVEPPEEYLAKTLTLRIHLDHSNAENGGVRIVAGTHRGGRVDSKTLLEIVENAGVIECNAKPGDVLLMCPLLFHSSRKAITPTHRRIVHIEYSAMRLPEPLVWHECAGLSV